MRVSKGAMLRDKKANDVTYTFTAAQLAERDRRLLNDREEELREKVRKGMKSEFDHFKADADEYINDEWKKREEIFKDGDFADHFFLLLSYLISVSVRVLVEKFHWKPVKDGEFFDGRNRLVRFATLVMDEVDRICADDKEDIRRYCEDTYRLYGVKFDYAEGEDDG